MAYIVNTTQTATATTSNYTVTLGAHVTGDLLLCLLNQDRPSGTTAITPNTAGWSMLGTGANSGANRSQWAWKVAASASEVSPNFSGENQPWIASCLVVRDADPLNPFGATPTSGVDYIRTDWNSTSTSVSGTVTTPTDDSLIIYSHSSDAPGASLIHLKYSLSESPAVDKYSTVNCAHIIGFSQQKSAGSTGAITMIHTSASEGGNGWVLVVRNKPGGALSPNIKADFTIIKHYGNFGSTQDGINWTNSYPALFSAAINGINCSSVDTSTAASITLNAGWGTGTRFNSSESTTGMWVGATHVISSANFTGKLFAVDWNHQVISTNPAVGSEGVIVGFSDGSNWVAYQLASQMKGWSATDTNLGIIAVGNAVEYASYGAINWGAVTRIGYFYHRIGSTATAVGLVVRNAILFGSVAIVGGGTNAPANWGDYQRLLTSWDEPKYSVLQGSGQILINNSVSIGDGTNTTYFDNTGFAVTFPPAYSLTQISNWQTAWNVNTQRTTISIHAGINDNIKLSAGVVAASNIQLFNFNASADIAASYTFAGTPIVGYSPTWKTGINCDGIVFAKCDTVNFKGTDVLNTTIKQTISTNASCLFDTSGATITNTTIESTADYHIELDTAVTVITFTEVTFVGTPAINKIHVLATAGTVTITVTDIVTNLVAADITSEGATVVIAAPVNSQTVTISGGVTGTRIQIYDLTSSTELYNGTPAFPYVWTDADPYVADREIRLRASYVAAAAAKAFIEQPIGTCTNAASALGYLLSQADDAVYNSNAIDGSIEYAKGEITITDSATDLVNINVAAGTISLKAVYAAFAYWNHTAIGIASETAYIQPVDTANYVFTDMQFKNISSPSIPTTLTGGYFWDSVTLSPLTCINTTGGMLFSAVPHVVPVIISTASAVVSGTAAEIIAAIPAGTQAGLTAQGYTPTKAGYISAVSDANIVKVNGTTIGGTGVEGDTWGPV